MLARPLWVRRPQLALVTAFVLSLGLVGCQAFSNSSQTPREERPEQRLLRAMDRMDDLRTARFKGNGRVTVETKDGSNRITTDLSADGSIVFPDRQKATVTVEQPVRVQTEMVRIGDDVWVKDPQRNQWVKESVDSSQLAVRIEPVQAITLARMASQDMKDMGNETVGGTETRHIQVVLDPTRTKLLLWQGNRELADKVERVEGTVDIWIDGSDLVRQVQPDIKLDVKDVQVTDQQTVEGRMQTKMTAQLDGFDEAISIEPPA